MVQGVVSRKATRAWGALQLVAAVPLAAQGGIAALFPAQPAGFVTDAAGVLDAQTVATITARIDSLRRATGAEIAVVTLPTIGEYVPVEVAVAIGRAWGVGADAPIGDERRDTGIVLLLVPRRAGDRNSGHIFIATGRGLEGIVTDAAAGRIRDRMQPQLAAGDYDAGLLTGTEALATLIGAGLSGIQAPGAETPRGGGPVVLGLVLVLLTLIVVGMVRAARTSSTRFPAAGRRRRRPPWWGGGFGGGFVGGFGGGSLGGGGFGGGGFGGFGGGGGFSGGGAGGRF